MKKKMIPIVVIFLAGCYANYPTTSFWINNNGEKTINFRATIIKQTSIGSQSMTLPFTVPPGDSVLFRRIGYHKNANPANVYSELFFFPLDSRINNPGDSLNWIKSIDHEGKPKYNFYIYPDRKRF